jgi:hypothetical protein
VQALRARLLHQLETNLQLELLSQQRPPSFDSFHPLPALTSLR